MTRSVIYTFCDLKESISLVRCSASGGSCKRHLPFRRSAIQSEAFFSQDTIPLWKKWQRQP